jgi:hypothetical protein
MTNASDEQFLENPSQRLVELCEQLCQGNLHLHHLIEEVHRTMEQWVAEETVPLDEHGPDLVGPQQGQRDEPSEPEEFMVDDDHRLDFGTNRLRAGAGACELVCSQAQLYELGCLLVKHASQCQAKQQPDG